MKLYILIIFAIQILEFGIWNLEFGIWNLKFGIWKIRDVAQPGSVHVWGAWGRKFKSCHPDLLKKHREIDAFFYSL